VSRHLFRSGLELVRNRGLADASPDSHAGRTAFLGYTRDVLRRLSVVHRIAVERVERMLVDGPESTRD
jgi:hypothetical protein